MKKIGYLLMLFLLVLPGCAVADKQEGKPQVVLGIERIGEYKRLFEGQRVGLITNQTGVDSSFRSSVDILHSETNLRGIFVPEHGLYGAEIAGEMVENAEYKGITVHSLYGRTRRPTSDMLKDIDVMAIDIQDIGARHYTYVSTMAYAMQECAKAGKKFVVFDRPNPLGGTMEGPVLKKGCVSFIGLYPIPLRHGMTIGELAQYIKEQDKLELDLTIIPMQGWKRSMYWRDTRLPWVGTSPLIPTEDTAIYYVTTGFVGDTNISVGVGTAKPFYYVGTPFADQEQITAKLKGLNLPGVQFRALRYIPRYGNYQGQVCKGAELYITDRNKFRAVETGAAIVKTFEELYPGKIVFEERSGAAGNKVDIALGEVTLSAGLPLTSLLPRWQREAQEFAQQVDKHLLYR